MENPRLGMRVRVNDSFPYGYHGVEGTIVKLPINTHVKGALKDWIGVAFDGHEQPYGPAEWHRNYFDVIEPDSVDAPAPVVTEPAATIPVGTPLGRVSGRCEHAVSGMERPCLRAAAADGLCMQHLKMKYHKSVAC